jgi:SprT protein
MPKKEAPLEYLDNYLPAGASETLLAYLHRYKVHLTITRTRKSILGDYRHATGTDNHRISVNGNLNKYAFLITLIHEIGHLITFQQYGNRVNAHGKEWKLAYRKVLEDFLRLKLFPADLNQALLKSLHDLPASSCSDVNLTRVLKKTFWLKTFPKAHISKRMTEKFLSGENRSVKELSAQTCVQEKNIYSVLCMKWSPCVINQEPMMAIRP